MDIKSEEEMQQDICDSESSAFIKLTVRNSYTETKTSYNGNVSGIKPEAGFPNENIVNNVLIIFYPLTDLKDIITGVSDPYVSSYIQFDENDIIQGNNISTVTKQVSGIGKTSYQALIIVNDTQISSQITKKTKISEILNYVQKDLWQEKNGIKTAFLMTNTRNYIIDFNIPSSSTSPLLLDVEVERLAARIDFILTYNNEIKEYNTYLIKDGKGNNLAKVSLSAIKLINSLNAGSFLIKRGYIKDDTHIYYHDENISNGYISDPWSKFKTYESLNGGFLYDNKQMMPSELYKNYYDKNIDMSEPFVLTQTGEYKDEDNNHYNIIDYTMENCPNSQYNSNAYATGMIFEAYYMPYSMIVYDETKFKNEEKENTDEKKDFYHYSEDNKIYSSLKALQFECMPDSKGKDPFADFFSFTSRWGDVNTYISMFPEKDVLGFKKYLQQISSDKNPDDLISEADLKLISWGNYEKSILDKTKELNNDVKFFSEGKMYYRYRIKHSNSDNKDNGMVCAIVRNNIYRIKVNSINSIGDPDPYNDDEHEDPDDNKKNFKIIISVADWQMINHPDIIM